MPNYALLRDQTLRGRIADLRNAVKPCLDGNFLPSFTDHSVEHSDRLCELIDHLAGPLGDQSKLTDPEAFVLYAACYLHDVGLQHQRADQTQCVLDVLNREHGGRRWNDLDISIRRKIVRQEHHRISGEIVRQSIDAPQPTPLGIQLTQNWFPGQIASLCIAHCLDTNSVEYGQLTQDWAGFRMSLLSALLRLADILDESRRRSVLYLERTRELDLESQMHWWRHYYVADVAFDPQARRITIWFDFPPQRRVQYREMIRPLQIPWIEAEFSRHDAVLARNSLHWSFGYEDSPEAQSTSKAMDNELEMYILEKLAKQREQQAERDKLVVLDQLKSVRPTIERAIEDLRSRESTTPPDVGIRKFCEFAQHLWKLGGRRDAWTTLWSEYNRRSAALTPRIRLLVALELAEMMIEEDSASYATRLLFEVQAQARQLPDDDLLKYQYSKTLARGYVDQCAYSQAIAELEIAKRLAPNFDLKNEATADLMELRFLQGDLNTPDSTANKGGQS